MSAIFKKLLSLLAPRRREYLTIDQEFNILDTSIGVQRFADCPHEVMKGKDVRIGFPELIGLEEILLDIVQGKQANFELKGLGRFSPTGSAVYFDIYVIKNQFEKSFINKLIVFLEDVTEQMVLEQNLVQASNENSLLLSK
ncbi:MAG: adenylate/guanylate cyclase, partial [Microcoleus sp. SIO2G3]|nr:adenylate/guanylate cyclase [Microcoleus sp. SIO2G3]